MLLLTVYTLCFEKKLSLSLLSIGSSSGSEEGSGDWQMAPELLNKAFSAKATRQKPWKHRKEPYDTLFRCTNKVCSRFCGNRQIDRHTHTDKKTSLSLWGIWSVSLQNILNDHNHIILFSWPLTWNYQLLMQWSWNFDTNYLWTGFQLFIMPMFIKCDVCITLLFLT